MEPSETKQSEQERVSSQAKKPKDNKTERRAFLKRAGIVTTGLCAPGLPKLAAAKTKEPKEPDKSLNEEIAQLEPEEKAALTTFLKGFWEIDRMLSPSLVQMYLNLTQAVVERQEKKANEEKARQEERKHRDSLTGQAKVDYVLEELRDGNSGISCYRTEFQREILEHIRDGQPLTTKKGKSFKEHYAYVDKEINQILEGCSKSFRRKVIDQYLTKVLPEMEAKQQEEDMEQEAYDGLINYLENNKTVEEVVALTEQLKRAGTEKGVSV